jgi:hypothetical protein
VPKQEASEKSGAFHILNTQTMDIAMCTDQECSRRFSCYRFTAPTDWEYQSMFAESPRKEEECDHYWDNAGRRLHDDYKQYERE